ncbi:MAG: hypothetical protein B6242_00065 [Anaerolineaceae bacterium 4572_78]|nr:MAG: hypothetical protein B6242_00065 [Anaerolineaceae bacterium 4572_78]
MVKDKLPEIWRKNFLNFIRYRHLSRALTTIGINKGDLNEWAKIMTEIAIATCKSLSWSIAAEGHVCDILPISSHKYLDLDIMAFDHTSRSDWKYPIAIIELESSQRDYDVAYSFWKLMSVRSYFRVLYCYRPRKSKGVELIHELEQEVWRALDLEDRLITKGIILVVVGGYERIATIPHTFFQWWVLNKDTGWFEPMPEEDVNLLGMKYLHRKT